MCISAETRRHNLIRLGQETLDFLVIGGGTNRALVQGLLEEVEKGTIGLDDVQIGSLRLGSGNLIQRYFGLPHEPLEGMRCIADDLFTGRTYPCCVYRCTFHYPNGETKQEYGLTMGGLGQFGRVPDDIRRWKEGHPRLMHRSISTHRLYQRWRNAALQPSM